MVGKNMHQGIILSFLLLMTMLVMVLCGVMAQASFSTMETVVSVYDGDTFTTASGKEIRLAGVDAPELKQPKGQECRDALASKIIGKAVQMTRKGKSYTRDVCTVSVNGSDIGSWMVRNGFAFDEPRYSKGAYLEDQAIAKRKRIGVWALKDGGERPWEHRHKKGKYCLVKKKRQKKSHRGAHG